MRDTITIPLALAAATAITWACKVDDPASPPVGCTAGSSIINNPGPCVDWCTSHGSSQCDYACENGNGNYPWCEGADTDWLPATDSGSDDGSGSSDSTGGLSFPCGEGTYLHECAFAIEPVYLIEGGDPGNPNHLYPLGQLEVLLDQPNERMCYSSAASEQAEHIAGGLVCGMLGVPESQACEDRCAALTTNDMGISDTVNVSGGTYNYLSHACVPAGSAASGYYTGTCAGGIDSSTVTITGTPCPEEYCEEPEADSSGSGGDGQELDCTTYDTHGSLTTTTDGRTIYGEVFESWADHIALYPGDVAKCDVAVYDWTPSGFGQHDQWTGVKSGSFFFALGMRNGDELVEAWEHDSNHDMVAGTRVVISDVEDAPGLLGLLPDDGADLALSLKFKRGSRYYTFHLDPR